jgi:hypothetical protein
MGKRAFCVAALMLATLTIPEAAAANWPYSDVPFCRRTLLRNYMAPIERLPALHHTPLDEGPAFKPRGVSINGHYDQLLPGGGSLGFYIYYSGRPAVRLNWLVTAKLAGVDRRGQILSVVDGKQKAIRRPASDSSNDFSFEVPGKPALYKTTLTIRKLSGELLGRYGQYARVLEPKSETRLHLSATSVHPGEALYARVENLGTELVSYGVPYAIDAFDGATWAPAPQSPKGPWILPLLHSAPGYSENCSRFLIPTDMAPGLYRFVKDVTESSAKDITERGRPRVLTAEFEVLP